MDLLRVSGLSKKIGDKYVVQDISFLQPRFRNIGIAGETGSGKSTLLKMIAGLIQPDEGTVSFEQQRVKGPDERLIPGHPGIAYLSQHYELRNHHRMEELLAYANELSDGDAAELYRLCRIDHLMKRKTDQLSGGEKQRIALARLLVGAPRLLILDEPFSNLDLIHKEILKDVLRDARERFGLSCLLASHDPTDTLPWADELLVLREGKLVQQGAPQEVFDHPVSLSVAGLLGSYNLLPAELSALFARAGGFSLKEGRALVRPDRLLLMPASEPHAPGLVRKVVFRGAYREVEAEVEGHLLKLHTTARHLAVGDNICLYLPEAAIHYL